MRRERKVWEALEHPNILPFYGYANDEDFQPFGAFLSPVSFLPRCGIKLTEMYP